MTETVLVPIDLSHPDQGAELLKTARRVAQPESRIIALHVAADLPGYVTAELPEEVLTRNREETHKALTALARAAGAEAVVRRGPVASEILECAEELGADLIVLGSHAPSLQDYLLGTTAARVVRHAPCSVHVSR